MREYRDVRKRLPGSGDGEQHIPLARKLLGILKTRAKLGGLPQLVRRYLLADGSELVVGTQFGRDVLEIIPPKKIPSQPGKLPVIIRGILGLPVSNDAPTGWGEPFETDQGVRIKPGTPAPAWDVGSKVFWDHADKGDEIPLRPIYADEWERYIEEEISFTKKLMIFYGGIDWQSTNKDPRLKPLVRPLWYEPDQDPDEGREILFSFGWLGFGRYVISWSADKGGEYFIYFEGTILAVVPRTEHEWTIVGVAWNEERDTLICAVYHNTAYTLEFWERPFRPFGYGLNIGGNIEGDPTNWVLMTGHNGVALEQNVLFNSDGDKGAAIANVGGTLMHTEWHVQADGKVTLEDQSAGAFGDNRYVRVDKITYGTLQLDEWAGQKNKFDSTCSIVPLESNWSDTCGTPDRIEFWTGYVANQCATTAYDCSTNWFDTEAAALACNIANGGGAGGVYPACGVQHYHFNSAIGSDHQWWEEHTGSEMHTGEVGASNPSVVVLCDWGNPRDGEGNIAKNSELVIRIEKFLKSGDYHHDYRTAATQINWKRTRKLSAPAGSNSTCSESYSEFTWNVVDAIRFDGDWGQTSCTVWYRDPDGNERPICNLGERTKNGREYKLRFIGSMTSGIQELEDCAFYGFPLSPQVTPWCKRWDVIPPDPGVISYLWPTNWPYTDYSSWEENPFKDQYEQIECCDVRMNAHGVRRINHTPPGWADEGVLVDGGAKYLLTPDPWDFIDTTPGSYVSMGTVLEEEIDLMWSAPSYEWEGGTAAHYWVKFDLYRLWEAYAHAYRNGFWSAFDRWQNRAFAHAGHAWYLHPETTPNTYNDSNDGNLMTKIQATGTNQLPKDLGVI